MAPDAASSRAKPALAGVLLASALGVAAGASAQTPAGTATGDEAREFSPIEVRARRLATEGSGSYAAPSVAPGGKVAVDVLDVPNSVSVVTRQRIEDQDLVDVESALREVTGVTVTPWDGATSQIRSRGYNLEAAYDGIPAYGALSAFQQFDLAIYDRIEVLRGPGGLFQGSSQPGGVANFVRKRGRDTFGGSAVLSVGSWSNARAELDVGGPLTADGALRSRLVASTQDRGYFYDTAESRKHLVYGTLDYDLGERTTVSLSATRQRDAVMPYAGLPAYTDQGFLDVPRSTYVYPDWVIQKWDKTALSLDLEHAFDGGWLGRVRLGRQTLDWDYRDSYPTGGVDRDTGTVASYARRRSDNAETRTALDAFVAGPFRLLGREHQVLAGMSLEDYESTTLWGQGAPVRDVPVLDPRVVEDVPIPHTSGYRSRTWQAGLYGQLRWALSERLTGVVGGRWSDFSVRSRTVAPQPLTPWTDGAKSDDEFTPYVGLVHRIADDVTVYASHADTFLPQTQRRVTGEAIDPRVGKQLEIGAKARVFGGGLQLSAAAFRTRDVNRAYPDTAHPGFFLQAGEVEIEGWEVEAGGSPLRNLDLTAGYTQLRTRYVAHQSFDAGEPFSLFEPRHAFKLFAHYRIDRGALDGLSIGGGAHVSSGLLGTGVAGVREQGGHAVASLHAGYAISPALRVSVAVNNLFDRHYWARVGGLNSYNMPGEPRNVMATLRARF
ncbi:hypothetical protein WQ56_08265 [Luteimonas sp. FCS-9]|nr:hypothetical protein WQ56_08265 [Luteimonas sp. FCS-9]